MLTCPFTQQFQGMVLYIPSFHLLKYSCIQHKKYQMEEARCTFNSMGCDQGTTEFLAMEKAAKLLVVSQWKVPEGKRVQITHQLLFQYGGFEHISF